MFERIRSAALSVFITPSLLIFAGLSINSAEAALRGEKLQVQGSAFLQYTSTTGAIVGKVSYPSEYIPPMRIYAISTDRTKHFLTKTAQNRPGFTIRNIEPGQYIVVAYTDDAPELIGGWTRAARCGTEPSCTDHTLLTVTVVAGKTTSGVEVSDWIEKSADTPAEPKLNSSRTTSPLISTNLTSDIRAVDFSNFTYELREGEKLILRNGKEEGEDEDGSRLNSVKYIDFNGDGEEEALVTIRTGSEGGQGFSDAYFVYSGGNSGVKQLFHESREKPQEMRVEGRTIIIVAPFWKEQDAGCCPSAIETTVYAWRGSSFTRLSRQLKSAR